MPFFDGLVAGEPDALLGSFAGEPECTTPYAAASRARGRSRPTSRTTSAWLRRAQRLGRERRARGQASDTASGRWFCTSTVRAAGRSPGRDRLQPQHRRPARRAADLLQRLADDRPPREHRPPLLQPDPELRESDVVGEYQRRSRRATWTRSSRRSKPTAMPATLRAVNTSRRPGRPARPLRAAVLERRRHPAGASARLIDNGRACALEYNVVRWGRDGLPRRPGLRSTCGARAAGSPPPASTNDRLRGPADSVAASASLLTGPLFQPWKGEW